MIGFKTIVGTEGAGAAGSFGRGIRGWVRSLGVVTWRSISNWFDPYIHGGKVAIEKGRVGSIILLQLVHVLC